MSRVSDFQIYLDVSRSDEDVYSLAGFLAKSEQWELLDRAWTRTLGSYGITCFHMTDWEARKGEFRNLEEVQRKTLLRNLLDLIDSFTVASASYSISQQAWLDEVEHDVKALVGDSPYYFVLLNLILAIEDLLARMQRFGVLLERPVLSVVLAKGDKGAGRAMEAWMGKGATSVRRSVGLNKIEIAADNRHCGLQAADIIAFEMRKQAAAMLKLHDRPPRYPLKRLETMAKPRLWAFYQFPWHVRFNSESVAREVLGKASPPLFVTG